MPAVSAEHAETSINEIILAFMRHAKTHYRRPDGTVTNEITAYRSALRIVKCLYGRETAVTFGPRALIVVREEMIRKGWVRTNINKQVSRIRSVFKWAASQQLVPATVYQSLQTVAGLQAGRTQAKESEPVQPVPEQHVIAIRPHVSRQVWTVAQLQQLTGARAGEIVRMRPVDLETTGEIWVYSPPQHKTRHHGHAHPIHLGPRAQDLVRPFLAGRPLDAYLFSPREAEAERREERNRKRKTPVQPSQRRRTKVAKSRTRRREPSSRYTTDSYRRAIQRACKRAGIPAWHPHQLRHTAATKLRKQYGIEAARVVLGHRSAAITEVYAQLDRSQAAEIMSKIG